MATRLNFEDVVLIGSKTLVLASAPEVDAVESQLWIKFPSGYREYMERLGEGCLGGSFLRIYPPWQITRELDEWRQRIRRYWLWDQSPELLPKARALECVILGDTGGGDELIFHPSRPDRLFVLGDGSEQVLEAGSDLLEAIEWMCSSGQITEAFSEREFDPCDSRAFVGERKKQIDPEGESLDDIVELGRRWAKRHSAREKYAGKVVAQELGRDRGPRTNMPRPAHQFEPDKVETELILEAIVLGGKCFSYKVGYMLSYSVNDTESRDKVGEFQVIDSGDPYPSPCYSFRSSKTAAD